ncbi:hypothetical protein RIR_jg19486.t1 [Rhizophagus irregularis DAOM 181602=DAOM 197198]|nr:hypothetical protein RIR_jg19486.t1 [Rhizophagus irregularis DAOM 181602=DAOM 197198]
MGILFRETLYRNSYRSSHKRNVKTSDTIILNVGGIKLQVHAALVCYYSYYLDRLSGNCLPKCLIPRTRQCLTNISWRDQILLSNRNACSCKSSKVFVSEQDLQQEIEYFQIPYFARQIDLALKRGVNIVVNRRDQFLSKHI